jgi:hypothetical protein
MPKPRAPNPKKSPHQPVPLATRAQSNPAFFLAETSHPEDEDFPQVSAALSTPEPQAIDAWETSTLDTGSFEIDATFGVIIEAHPARGAQQPRGAAMGPAPAQDAQQLRREEELDFLYAHTCARLAAQQREARAAQGLPDEPVIPSRAQVLKAMRARKKA